MKDYYTIGEISKLYNIGRDSLRYYEEIGLLDPLRDENGYRLYSMQNIWKLNVIKDLKNLGFSMKMIKRYLDNRTVDSTEEILRNQVDLIEEKIQELEETKKNMTKRLQNIEDIDRCNKLNTIEVIFYGERKALQLNGRVSRDEEIDFLIKKLQRQYEDKLYLLGNNNIGAVLSMEKIKENIYDRYESVFFLLDPKESDYNLILDGGHYVTLSYRGSYDQSQFFIAEMFAFIEENGYEILSSPIEIYKIDIHETSKVEEFVTEIQIPVKINI